MEIPDPTAPNTFPPAQYTITPEGDGYRVTIPEMGDLEGLRQDLRELGVPAFVVPSPGYGDCDDNSAFPGANVAAPGVWEFVVRPGRFGADQQLAIWNNANSQGMLLIRTYCEVN